MLFVWDRHKAASNLRKHRISFDEAVAVFADPLARIFADPDHSETEEREIIVGYNSANVLLVVSFTDRDGDIRLISARRATVNERHAHETYLK